MSKHDERLCLENIHISLAGHPYFNTNDTSDIDSALYTNFHRGRIDIYRNNTFQMIYNHVKVGSVSLNAAATTSGFAIHADSDASSFALIVVTHGHLEVPIKGKKTYAIPDQSACLLDFERPSIITVQPFYNNMTVRFTRSAIEQLLVKFSGKPLRKPLHFVNQVDLSRPGPRRLLAIINQTAAFFEQDPALAHEPLLLGQYEQLLLAALLTGLDHNGRELLCASQAPAPPKVVALVEGFLEANADKPLNLGDLAELTGMSARSIQLAFQKHRGYSPSRFLRECRLAKAHEMLRRAAPGTNVLSVSLACGFASQSFFCRLYRQRFGETPSETAAKA